MKFPSWVFSAGAFGVVLIAIGALWIYTDGKRAGERKLLTDRISALEDSNGAYQHSLDSVGRIKRVDTVRFVAYRNRVIAKHDTVLSHLTDTVRVKEFLYLQDSTIKACTVVVSDCEAQRQLLSKQLNAVVVERDTYKRLGPTLIQRHTGVLAVLAAVGGFVIGNRLH